jgi:antitoxin YefM
MAIHASYSHARAHLAALWDKAVDDRETVIISRRGAKNIALIAEDELESLSETAHLLRSPRNAARLIQALERALARTERPQTVDELRVELGLADAAS